VTLSSPEPLSGIALSGPDSLRVRFDNCRSIPGMARRVQLASGSDVPRGQAKLARDVTSPK
jgi:hypothetical protein